MSPACFRGWQSVIITTHSHHATLQRSSTELAVHCVNEAGGPHNTSDGACERKGPRQARGRDRRPSLWQDARPCAARAPSPTTYKSWHRQHPDSRVTVRHRRSHEVVSVYRARCCSGRHDLRKLRRSLPTLLPTRLSAHVCTVAIIMSGWQHSRREEKNCSKIYSMIKEKVGYRCKKNIEFINLQVIRKKKTWIK